MDYTVLNRLLSKSFTRFFPKTINRKIFRKYKIYFVPTKLKSLPKSFYPMSTTFNEQKDFVHQYRKQKKLINQTTKKNLDKFLIKFFKKSGFTFLDVGGDNIDLFLHLSKNLNIKKYYLYNFKNLINLFKKIKDIFQFNHFYPVQKINLIKKIDFAYFGSCIQYFDNYKNFLRSITKKKPKYIFFSGTTFFHDNIHKNKIVVKQTNILPNTIYLFFFNFSYFIKLMNSNGYKLVFYEINKTAKVNYKNFSFLIKKVQYLDILFKKR